MSVSETVTPIEAFHMYDLTGSGKLLVEDVPKALGYAGITVDLATIADELGEEFPPTAALTLEQFTQLVDQISAKGPSDADTELKESFAALADGSTMIPARSLVHIMGTIGEPLPADKLELLLTVKGFTLDSNLSEAQFVSLIKS